MIHLSDNLFSLDHFLTTFLNKMVLASQITDNPFLYHLKAIPEFKQLKSVKKICSAIKLFFFQFNKLYTFNDINDSY